MGIKLKPEIITALVISCIVALLILLQIPVKYLLGFILVATVLAIFLVKPLYFLFCLFFFRAAFDNYFTSIRVTIGKMEVGLGGLIAVALVAVMILYVLVYTKNLDRLGQIVICLYFMFLLVSVVSFLIAPERAGALKVLVRRMSVLSIVVLTILNIHSEKDARLLLKAIIFSAVIPIIVGCIVRLKIGGRFTGTFSHPNILAFYLLIIIGCVLARVDSPPNYPAFPIWRKIYLGILGTVLLLTLTRSAWAACFLMVGIYVVFIDRKWLIPVVVVGIFASLLPFVKERIMNLFDFYPGSIKIEYSDYSSLGWRFRVWGGLFAQAIKRPLTGYGINATSFITAYPVEAHNDYLRFFVESGFPGVIMYYASYFYLLLDSLRNRASFAENSHLRKMSVLFICLIPAFLLMSMTENLARYTTTLWYFWGLIGVYFGLIGLKRESEIEK